MITIPWYTICSCYLLAPNVVFMTVIVSGNCGSRYVQMHIGSSYMRAVHIPPISSYKVNVHFHNSLMGCDVLIVGRHTMTSICCHAVPRRVYVAMAMFTWMHSIHALIGVLNHSYSVGCGRKHVGPCYAYKTCMFRTGIYFQMLVTMHTLHSYIQSW